MLCVCASWYGLIASWSLSCTETISESNTFTEAESPLDPPMNQSHKHHPDPGEHVSLPFLSSFYFILLQNPECELKLLPEGGAFLAGFLGMTVTPGVQAHRVQARFPHQGLNPGLGEEK